MAAATWGNLQIMPQANSEVAAAFNEIADLLEISGAEKFRVLAYRRAASSIESFARDLKAVPPEKLSSLQGIGKAMAAMILEYLETGKLAKLEEVRATVPSGLRELTTVSGLGPKKVLLVHEQLGISTVDELEAAIQNHRLREVKGLGAKTEENIAKALKARRARKGRTLIDVALATAEHMIAELKDTPGVNDVAFAGSLRRAKETIGDLDLLVTGTDPKPVMDRFTRIDGVTRIEAFGETKTSVVSGPELQVDLRFVAPEEFGSAMQYFTGSKEHNVKVREIAVKKGLKLSEYGLFEVKGSRRIAGETEESVYEALGMQTPLPTMRENRGEVELALKGALPEVVRLDQLRGDLHSHSNYSDGTASVEEMAREALRLGHRFIALTDHGRRSHVKSLSLEDIRTQRREIDRLNEELGGQIAVLHGVELNIGPEGDLDYPDEVISQFDVVVASVHHSLQMEYEPMTRRILKALDNPLVNIFGHPTARRIGRREPIDADLERIFERAVKRNVAVEINSNPSRLDLKDDHIRLAREIGCKFAIDSDAHSTDRLSLIKFGVMMAQRGWVTPGEVVNCLSLPALRNWILESRAH